MFRFGCATPLHTPSSDYGSQLYARCVTAHQLGLGVVRIPTSLAPLHAPQTTALLRDIIYTHRLRLVIHAAFAPPQQLIPQFATYAHLMQQLACRDAVIICHVPHLDATTAQVLTCIDPDIRQFLALEHTHQHPDTFWAFAQAVGLPAIFDWLHYHIQAPWPYDPAQTACMWAHSWQKRRPLIHMSSPSERGAYGAHGSRIDSTCMAWLLRTLKHQQIAADIELESSGGIHAYQRLRRELTIHAPDILACIVNGESHAHTH